ncbi:hypothetical protein HZC30_00235 [Candidatus Woesearchaeota archaeon]|nr:hypothetical protein [Candidatus Woesearchaeota archaeon]
MGMFDTIEVAHTCTCGEKLPDYQTKALGNVLVVYRLGEKVVVPDLEIVIGSFEIHGHCSNCHRSIEGKAYIKDGLLWRVVEMDEKGNEKVVVEYVPGE